MEFEQIVKPLLEKYDIDDLNLKKLKEKLNTSWYDEKEIYSDGDVETDILNSILTTNSEEERNQIGQKNSWPFYYYFSEIRKNILSWYPFEKNASVLEIGCGMGAITGLLCEKCKNVTSIEISLRRGISTLFRNEKYDNLEVIVGNLNNIELKQKYDYITLIGVLEYQGIYTKNEKPYVSFLKQISTYLKPKGKLLIAIENKFGLKYWCGAEEDHTGIPFDGLNDYYVSNKKIRTFSKHELIEILDDAGLINKFFYYPYPDYKFPIQIYSEQYKVRDFDSMKFLSNYYGQSMGTVIDGRKIMNDLVKNDVNEFFSNSFLIECTCDTESRMGQNDFISFSNERMPDYRVVTIHNKKGFFEKYPMSTSAEHHIKRIAQNLREIKERGIETISFDEVGQHIIFPEIKEKTLSERIEESILNADRIQLWLLIDIWMKQLETSSDLIIGAEGEKILKMGYIDMIPQNAFCLSDNRLIWFDQEWSMEKIPVKFIIYRGIETLYNKKTWLEEKISIEEIWNKYYIDLWIDKYELIEMECFQKKVSSRNRYLSEIPFSVIECNIKKFNFSDNIIDPLMEFEKKKKNIYLYGAGNNGQKVSRILKKLNIKFKGFVVSDDQAKNSMCEQYDILLYTEILEKHDVQDIAIIMTIQNSSIRNKIIDRLQKDGIHDIYIF